MMAGRELDVGMAGCRAVRTNRNLPMAVVGKWVKKKFNSNSLAALREEAGQGEISAARQLDAH